MGAREWSEGVGEVGGGGDRQEETRGEKWSWASRVRQRSPVPGARLGKEEEEGVEAVRGPMERRRGPVTEGLREDSEWGELAAGGTGTRGRSGRWQTPRGPRRV